MASRYSQQFTLKEIFNDKRLKGVFPLINYKEKEDEDGKTHRTTAMKTVGRLVFDTSVSSARPYYRPVIAHKAGGLIVIGGNLVEDLNDAENAVYEGLMGIKDLIGMTASNAGIIRSALKETERSGAPEKLYLREKSIQQIASLDRKGKMAFMREIMDNIFFGNYPKTQKKINIANAYGYADEKAKWEKKVGL